jgi:PTS system mannose-specific IID component
LTLRRDYVRNSSPWSREEVLKEARMRRSELVRIFLRSLTIQASLNFWRMQNLGFAFSILPLAKSKKRGSNQFVEFLVRHLEVFNTHPYLLAPILGTVVSFEERDAGEKAAEFKSALSAPYAAIGDSFFWGAFRPFAGIATLVVAFLGYVSAPLIMLGIYNMPHFWVRIGGFWSGYRKGQEGIQFIRDLDLYKQAKWIRWISIVLLGVLGFIASRSFSTVLPCFPAVAVLPLILIFFEAIRKGLSQLILLYGVLIVALGIEFLL